jgi:glyoxylase-like metal-dependent hydrolase (beta-lactamase superfamily II)/8-oxo-dGTP pyrophosphatase MutT (NUDIX family)
MIMAPSSTAPVLPRAAASLIVLRDTSAGLQVLLLRRAEKPGDQNSGAAVFPGGLLDTADRSHYERCQGLDDAAASARLGLRADGLHYWVAAVRECFEEAGLLFAVDAQGAPVDLRQTPVDELWAMRRALHANEIGMAEVCERLGVRLAVGELAYFSHWITPLGMPKIFDTRFFVTRVPAGQTALHDGDETVELLWLTPAQALDKARGLKLMNVTERTLQQLAGFASADQAMAATRAIVEVPVTRPRLASGPKGRMVVNPREPAFAEIGRLDPEGHGQASAELLPGRPVWLSPRVLRVTAPNGNMMTGPGTNSYFIGAPGGDEWALLDAGPFDATHVQALRDAAPGKVTRMLVTHTHSDHSPAVAALRAETGAATFGRVADHPEWQDKSFVPDHVLSDGDRLVLGVGVTLRAIHTPGHASNHLCYLLEEEKLLFTGDHLMQGTTVVINPPDGDMAEYLASLERLLGVDLEWLAPGHGFLMDAPHDEIRRAIAHRRAREAMVLADVQGHGPADESVIVSRVYESTDRRLHGVALRSLRAHLLKLKADGSVTQQPDGSWRATTVH